MSTAPARLAVLGPIRVDGRDPGGPLARALLTALALAPRGTARSVDGLVDDVWGDDLPQHPRSALQSLVSRVRTVCGDDVLESRPGGYALACEPECAASDLAAAERLLGQAEEAGPGDRSRLDRLDDALGLWRGEPAADLGAAPVAEALRARSAELRSSLQRLRATSLTALGRGDEAAAALEDRCAALPLDEPLHGEFMRALASAGRTGEALAVFAALRTRLRDELGVSPGAAISSLNAELLRSREEQSAPPVRVGVPAPSNPLIGREAELRSLTALLEQSRLVTVLGVGGLGKTSLVRKVAYDHPTGRIVFVPLAGVRTDSDVAPAIAAALGISETASSSRIAEARPRPELRTRVLGALGERRTLLVLDNCEQVVAGVASWTADALDELPELRVLATSRTPLLLTAERVFPLAPLAVAVEADAPSGSDPADKGPAVRLFLERARAVRPGARLDRDTIARLCERLDGLPLAIELAAARVRTMTPEQIEDRLEDRFALLTSGDRSAPVRHRTLEAVIEWSWDLLDDEARATLGALSLLPGGFSAETAAGVLAARGADGTDARADDVLDRLVSQSLLVVFEDPGLGGVRFRMLETVREFGIARLRREGAEDRAWSAVCAWGRDFVLGRAPRAFGPPGSLGPLEFRIIRAEQDNLLAALRRSISLGLAGDVTLVFGILAQSWVVRGAHTELNGVALESLDSVLRAPVGEIPADAVALGLCMCAASLVTEGHPSALRAIARLRLLSRDPAMAELRPLWRSAVELISSDLDPVEMPRRIAALADSPDPETRLLGTLFGGLLAENGGATRDAQESARLAWALSRELEESWLGAMAASSAAQLANQSARPAEALDWLDRAIDELEAFDAQDELRERNWLRGAALVSLGRTLEARSLFERLTAETELRSDGREHSSIGWFGLAEIARIDGDAAAAVDCFERSLAEFSQLDRRASPWYLITLAGYVSAAAMDGLLPDATVADLARRLRTRALATHRVQPLFVDRPVLGTILAGWSGWAVTVEKLRNRALEALVLAEALAARQDLPSLSLSAHLAHATAIAGSPAVERARLRVAELPDEQRVPRALEVLAAPAGARR